MAGKKYGLILQAQVKGSYFTLPQADQDAPGEIFGDLLQKYGGKVELVRRYWTRAFNAHVTDVLVLECDDPADLHAMIEEMTRRMAESGDPDRFGEDVSVTFGINPDAG